MAHAVEFKNGGFELKLDGAKEAHIIAADGTVTLAGKAVTDGVALQKVATGLDESLVARIAASGKGPAFEEVVAMSGVTSKLAAPKSKAMLDAAAQAEAIYTKVADGKATPEQIKELGAIFGKTPEAEKLLNQSADLIHMGEHMDRTGISAYAAKVKAAHTELDALTRNGATKAQILTAVEKHGAGVVGHLDTEILATEFGGAARVRGAAAEAAFKVSDVVAEVNTKAAGLKSEATALYTKIVGLSDAASKGRGSKAITAKADLKTAAEALAKLKNDNANYAHAFGEALEAHPQAEKIRNIDALNNFVSSVSKASEGVKSGLSFFSFNDQFKVTDNLIAKKIEGAAGNAEKIAKFREMEVGALRKGKLAGAIVGLGAVTYAIVSAVGGKPKHSQQVMDQQQQVAGGRA